MLWPTDRNPCSDRAHSQAMRASHLVWIRYGQNAIERLQAKAPAEGGVCSGLSLSARARSARAH